MSLIISFTQLYTSIGIFNFTRVSVTGTHWTMHSTVVPACVESETPSLPDVDSEVQVAHENSTIYSTKQTCKSIHMQWSRRRQIWHPKINLKVLNSHIDMEPLHHGHTEYVVIASFIFYHA